MSESVVGTLEGIIEKPNGWFEIQVAMPGKQYPLRLGTKKQEYVELARAAGTNVMAWAYTEQESEKINEHTGKPYVNRYFEGVAPVGSEGAETASPATGAPARTSDAMSKDEWAAKDSAIHKMAAIKTAADALKHTVPADPGPEDLTRFLDRVAVLSTAWHRVVIAVRDDPAGEDVPF